MTKLTVQSLWVGDRLSRMEYYSIKSFLNLGYTFHLYTYNKVKNVPKGTIIKDASKIMPKKEVFDLKTTYLPFSDIWRYKMLYEIGGYWVDVDLIALKRFDFKEPFVFSSERTIQGRELGVRFASVLPYVPNIGVLKAPPKSEFYKEAYEKCMEYNKKFKNDDKLKYMKMLRKLIKKYKYEKYVKMPKVFCNLDWWHAKEAFMPLKKYPDKHHVKAPTIKSMFNGPYTVHFWRDKVTKKHNLSLDAKYDPNSLWELMISYVDMYGKQL
tara:strand:+ start:25 stop:828 length:804 start_codon:yes stop_codon:yes gene_type:complete